jgi:hypothetical protein
MENNLAPILSLDMITSVFSSCRMLTSRTMQDPSVRSDARALQYEFGGTSVPSADLDEAKINNDPHGLAHAEKRRDRKPTAAGNLSGFSFCWPCAGAYRAPLVTDVPFRARATIFAP